MTVLAHPRVRKWLSNFSEADVPNAELLVTSLAYIGAEDVRAGLTALLQRLLVSIQEPVAIFPAREILPVGAAGHAAGRNGKYVVFDDPMAPGSEAIISNIITSTRRMPEFGSRLTTSLGLAKLREERVRSIFIVDDFSGSGKRLLDFRRALTRHATIRSWQSYHLLDVHVVVYMATKEAVSALRQSYGKDNVHFAQPCQTFHNADWSNEQFSNIEELCKKYGKANKKFALGFKKSRTLAVLPWTAPNNLPFVLWKINPGWHSLFEGKVVPNELLKLFGREPEDRPNPTDLSIGAAKRLGHVLDAIQLRIKDTAHIAEAKNMSFAEVERLRNVGHALGLIGLTGRLTESGLAEWRRRALEHRRMVLPNHDSDYYPSQLRVGR